MAYHHIPRAGARRTFRSLGGAPRLVPRAMVWLGCSAGPICLFYGGENQWSTASSGLRSGSAVL